VEVPDARIVALELRYSQDGDGKPVDVSIDGKAAGQLALWSTGGKLTWGWDRIPCQLPPGQHTIRIRGLAEVNVDHLNLIERF
jgi:hypothetical protein